MDSNFLPRWTQHQINIGGIKLSASDVHSVPALCWFPKANSVICFSTSKALRTVVVAHYTFFSYTSSTVHIFGCGTSHYRCFCWKLGRQTSTVFCPLCFVRCMPESSSEPMAPDQPCDHPGSPLFSEVKEKGELDGFIGKQCVPIKCVSSVVQAEFRNS